LSYALSLSFHYCPANVALYSQALVMHPAWSQMGNDPCGSFLKLHLHARLPVTAGARLVADVIDFEQRDEGMMVAHGICDQLDDMKHEYAGLPDFLTRVRLLLLGPLAHCAPSRTYPGGQSAGINHYMMPICAQVHVAFAITTKTQSIAFRQVVEAELQRIPRALLRGHSQELWSIVYMPQASATAFAARRSSLLAHFIVSLRLSRAIQSQHHGRELEVAVAVRGKV